MSIVTKAGDAGETTLMYGRRVSKGHPRVKAYGEVDEVSAFIGLARAGTQNAFLQVNLETIQKELIVLMGELATATEDLPRFVKDGFRLVRPEMTAKLEQLVTEIEGRQVTFRGWAIPGASAEAAALDVARTVCRRAERSVCALQEAGQLHNSEIIVYLNRLSDLLWLLARVAEQGSGHP
jgi:cob(I)alamin adenosyltransferase